MVCKQNPGLSFSTYQTNKGTENILPCICMSDLLVDFLVLVSSDDDCNDV